MGCGEEQLGLENTTELLTQQNECGGTTPCSCGDILTKDRKLDHTDSLENCDWNTTTPILTIKNGAKLDCDFHTISVRPHHKWHHHNIRAAIELSYDSSGTIVQNCNIWGASTGIHVELKQELVHDKVKGSYFKSQGQENLAFINNQIFIGVGDSYYSGEGNGILINGWWNPQKPHRNILIMGNCFGMTRSAKDDKESFLNYGSYIRTTCAKNLFIMFNTFDDINHGYALRFLYGVEAIVMGNKFYMPWGRIKGQFSKAGQPGSYWVPSGMAFELFNGPKHYPKFTAWFNEFYIDEDPQWPPEPFGSPPTTGVNHEYVIIQAAPGANLPTIDMRFNWWRNMSGKDYLDTEIPRLVYDGNFTVGGVKVEPKYRKVVWKPRLK